MMQLISTKIPNVRVIKSEQFADHRGVFQKIFSDQLFHQQGIEFVTKESYYSVSHAGVIRGMHFHTPPKDHAKIVYVCAGEVTDVLLDLRLGSPMYGQFEVFSLNESTGTALYIPSGVAHGFRSLADKSVVSYLQSGDYSAENDQGVSYDSFGMDWQLKSPSLSTRDLSFPSLADFNSPFRI